MKVITTVAGVKVLRSFTVGDQFLDVNIKGQCHEIFEPFLGYQITLPGPLGTCENGLAKLVIRLQLGHLF